MKDCCFDCHHADELMVCTNVFSDYYDMEVDEDHYCVEFDGWEER